jgi:hypothetical protein
MNKTMKRANNIVSMHQRIEFVSEAVTPGAGQDTTRTSGWRALLGRLPAGVKALWARRGSDKSPLPGRDLQQMVLTYCSGDNPVQNKITSCTEAHRRCSVA